MLTYIDEEDKNIIYNQVFDYDHRTTSYRRNANIDMDGVKIVSFTK